jgi:hypothetical protein
MVVVPEDRSGQVLASFAEEKQHHLVTMKKCYKHKTIYKRPFAWLHVLNRNFELKLETLNMKLIGLGILKIS